MKQNFYSKNREVINKDLKEKEMKEKTNREKLEELGEGCSYEKACDQCEVNEKCSEDIKER